MRKFQTYIGNCRIALKCFDTFVDVFDYTGVFDANDLPRGRYCIPWGAALVKALFVHFCNPKSPMSVVSKSFYGVLATWVAVLDRVSEVVVSKYILLAFREYLK